MTDRSERRRRYARGWYRRGRYGVSNALARARGEPGRYLTRAAVLFALSVSALGFVAPLYWLFSVAFRAGELGVPPQVLPARLTVEHLYRVVRETAFVRTALTNSLVVSVATVALTVGIATPAGYALARDDLRYRTPLLVSLLVVQMIPIVAMIVPLYRLFALVGLLDSLAVIVLADTALVVPVAIWLLKGYFETLPGTLEEAALVGGASRFRAFLVIVPAARPAIGAVALYAFVISWNQFVVPLTFTSSAAIRTYPVALYGFISRYGVVDWQLLGAASLVAMLPVLLLFVLFQRWFVDGVISPGYDGGNRG